VWYKGSTAVQNRGSQNGLWKISWEEEEYKSTAANTTPPKHTTSGQCSAEVDRYRYNKPHSGGGAEREREVVTQACALMQRLRAEVGEQSPVSPVGGSLQAQITTPSPQPVNYKGAADRSACRAFGEAPLLLLRTSALLLCALVLLTTPAPRTAAAIPLHRVSVITTGARVGGQERPQRTLSALLASNQGLLMEL